MVATTGVLVTLGIALLASLALGARHHGLAASAGQGGVPCPTAGEPASDATANQLRRSVRCLINEERAVRGHAKVVRDRSLQKAAQKHTKTMVETGCLAHRCEGEVDLETRVRRAGYFEGAEMWEFAENTGCGVSAEAMVSNWMASRFHRVNIVDKDFRDIGVGVTQKPVDERCDEGYATFAIVLGWRKPGS